VRHCRRQLTLSSDYTVTLLTPPSVGQELGITSNVAILQPLALTNSGGFYPKAIESALDRIVILLQQLGAVATAQTLRVPETAGLPMLPAAGMQLLFDAQGQPYLAAPVSGSAADVMLQLASPAAGKGGALVSHSATAAYAAGTMGAKAQQTLCPLDHPWLAKGDGSDDTAALCAFFAAVPSNSIIDLAGRSYAVHGSVAGTASGDAVPLGSVPRLSDKSGITIRNGTIFAKSPSVSGSKVHFPSTLAIDGCTDITLIGVTLRSKGESWGDSDASVSLGVEARRAFLAQNGGHALVVTRSRGVYGLNCRFELCGSVASLYASSSDDLEFTACYSTPKSLGYAAFAADSWCGDKSVSGYAQHEMVLNNCSSDNGGATYGSKGAVFAEDADVVVLVNGGSYRHCFANGSSNFLGAAFSSVNAALYVSGAEVEDCAAIGLTYHSAAGTSKLECTGVVARNLRTSVHINANNPFGASNVTYRGCSVRFGASPSLWGSAELSQLTAVANQKIASVITVDLIGCDIRGPKYLSWNTRGCYGGIKISGGYYEIYDQIFKSVGWGGSGAGSARGFEIGGGAKIRVSNPAGSGDISSITNNDGLGVATYLYVDVDDSVTIDSAKFRSAESIGDTTGGTLTERLRLGARLIGCGSVNARSQVGSVLKVVSLDGAFGSTYRLTVSWPIGVAVLGTTWDDAGAARRLLSFQAVPAIVGNELRAQINVSGASAAFTAGSLYPVAGV
jgi:hypothetical protein